MRQESSYTFRLKSGLSLVQTPHHRTHSAVNGLPAIDETSDYSWVESHNGTIIRAWLPQGMALNRLGRSRTFALSLTRSPRWRGLLVLIFIPPAPRSPKS